MLGVLSLNIKFNLASFKKYQIGKTGHVSIILVQQPEKSEIDINLDSKILEQMWGSL